MPADDECEVGKYFHPSEKRCEARACTRTHCASTRASTLTRALACAHTRVLRSLHTHVLSLARTRARVARTDARLRARELACSRACTQMLVRMHYARAAMHGRLRVERRRRFELHGVRARHCCLPPPQPSAGFEYEAVKNKP